jgi:hypothetical protein
VHADRRIRAAAASPVRISTAPITRRSTSSPAPSGLYDGTRWFDATPGDTLYVPAGGIHGFTSTSGAPASMLMLLTPGADRAAYFGELAAIAAEGRELSDAEWAEVFARHDNGMLRGDRTR